MASALGAAIAMPVCGFMISAFGWPSVFYLTGECRVSFRVQQQFNNFFQLKVESVSSGHCVGSSLFSRLQRSIQEFLIKREKRLKTQSVSFLSRLFILVNVINLSISGSSTSKKRPSYVPWLSIITAPCVWAIIIVHTGSVFGYFLVVNQLPGYMKTILKYDIKSNGLLSSLPYFGKYAMSVSASYFADHLRKTGKMSTIVARKVRLPNFLFKQSIS